VRVGWGYPQTHNTPTQVFLIRYAYKKNYPAPQGGRTHYFNHTRKVAIFTPILRKPKITENAIFSRIYTRNYFIAMISAILYSLEQTKG
jgi:hypothetical protein